MGLGFQHPVTCFQRLGSVFHFSWEAEYTFGKLSHVLLCAMGPEHSTEEFILSLVGKDGIGLECRWPPVLSFCLTSAPKPFDV